MIRLLGILVMCVSWMAAAAATPDEALSELRRGFTVRGKPIPPKIFADFGDDDLADATHSIWVTVDLLTAVGSNLYAEPVSGSPGAWLSQKNGHEGEGTAGEAMAYHYVGATHGGLMVAVAAFHTAGSGSFYTLHVLDAAVGHGFDDEGKLYDRLNLTVLRNLPLGDRWKGDVKIDGDVVIVSTLPGQPNNSNTQATTTRFEARRP